MTVGIIGRLLLFDVTEVVLVSDRRTLVLGARGGVVVGGATGRQHTRAGAAAAGQRGLVRVRAHLAGHSKSSHRSLSLAQLSDLSAHAYGIVGRARHEQMTLESIGGIYLLQDAGEERWVGQTWTQGQRTKLSEINSIKLMSVCVCGLVSSTTSIVTLIRA